MANLPSHPVLIIAGLIGSLASLVSIPLAVYFYLTARERPELTYALNPGRTTLARAERSSDISIVYKGKEVGGDITLVQIAFWNNGSRSIRKADILRPTTLHIESGIPILEAFLTKRTREVTGLTLNADDLASGRIGITWEILEHDDGGVIQLIYAGGPDINVWADGAIAGQKELDRIELFFSAIDYDPNPTITSYAGLLRTVCYVLLCYGFVAIVIMWVLWRRKRRTPKWQVGLVVSVVILIAVLTLVFVRESSPPFTF